MNMFYVYVLQGKYSNKIYTGLSGNVNRRLRDHNSGRVRTTKKDKPYEIIYVKEFENRIDARKHEKYLKSGFGRKYLRAFKLK